MGQRYIVGVDSRQSSCLPEILDDLISEDNPVRFLEIFVDSMNLQAMGFVRSKPAHTGRPSYHPGDLLKLYLYGYLNRIRSSRRLEKECARNIELWWLLNRLRPDHNTISDFRMENRKALKKVFQSFVRTCVSMGLADASEICIDGTKIRAVNSKKQSTSIELTKKKLAYAKEQLALVEAYLSDMDDFDRIDQGKMSKAFALDISKDNLPNPEDLRQRIRMHESHLEIMAERKEKQITFTDPECRNMHTKDGSFPSYNIQTATETKNHLIVAFKASNNSSDHGQLQPTAQRVQEELGQGVVTAIADKGYEGFDDLKACLLGGVIPEVSFKYDRHVRVFSLDYIESQIDEATKNSTKIKDIRACLHAGILPACYDNGNLDIEIHRESVVSCFIRHDDGRVTCPAGHLLCEVKSSKSGKTYSSMEACRTCRCRCTDANKRKSVLFGPKTVYVKVLMYGNPDRPLQTIPDVINHKKNNTFGRVPRASARVMIFMKRDKQKQRKRMQVVEHPFGTIKWHDHAQYFLCKGLEKIEAEVSLSYLSYNIRRAIKLIGVQGLIMHFCKKTTV